MSNSTFERLNTEAAAWSYGNVWTNEIFVNRSRPIRLWKTSMRATAFGYILMGLSIVVLSVVFYGVFWLLQHLWPLFYPFIFGPFFGLILGVPLGRALAKASPYRRVSGENFGSFLMVQADSKSYLLGKLIKRRVSVNPYLSYAGTGRPEYVECIEWLGTARAPRTPKRTEEMNDSDTILVALPPKSVEVRRRRKRQHIQDQT